MELIHTNYKIGEDATQLLEVTSNIIKEFYEKEVQLKDGVMEWLRHCKNNGVKMCIASATTPDLIEIALKHCDIDKYFEKIFSCGVIGKGKDQPDIYLLAQEYLGSTTDEIWVFEDSLLAIETATKIGMKTVGIYDKYNFGQQQIKKIATEYIAEGEKLTKLISE